MVVEPNVGGGGVLVGDEDAVNICEGSEPGEVETYPPPRKDVVYDEDDESMYEGTVVSDSEPGEI